MVGAVIGILSLIVGEGTALAQLDRIGGSVEFRAPDRPIAAPPLRDPQAVGLPSESSKFPDRMGPPSTDTVLRNLDKELGRTETRSTDEPDRGPSERPFRPGEDLGTRAPAPTTLK